DEIHEMDCSIDRSGDAAGVWEGQRRAGGRERRKESRQNNQEWTGNCRRKNEADRCDDSGENQGDGANGGSKNQTERPDGRQQDRRNCTERRRSHQTERTKSSPKDEARIWPGKISKRQTADIGSGARDPGAG